MVQYLVVGPRRGPTQLTDFAYFANTLCFVLREIALDHGMVQRLSFLEAAVEPLDFRDATAPVRRSFRALSFR